MTKQKIKHEVFFTSIEGRFNTLKELLIYHKVKQHNKSINYVNSIKKYQHLKIEKHIIRGSEPLLPYKFHPKFTDYCIDIEGNVFKYTKQNGFHEILPYINTNEKMGVNDFNDKGYATIQPHIDGKRYLQYHHRMVAEAWIPNPNKFKVVNHLNEVKWDNRVMNLEWTTQKKNNYHSRERRKKGFDKARKNGWGSKPKLRQWKVFQIYKNGKFVAEGKTLKELGDLLGLSKVQINYIRHQKNKMSKGLKETKFSGVEIKKVQKEEWYT